MIPDELNAIEFDLGAFVAESSKLARAGAERWNARWEALPDAEKEQLWNQRLYAENPFLKQP